MASSDRIIEMQEQLRAEAMTSRATAPGIAPAAWYCEDCLEAIPEARRLAMPGCTRCVNCQSMADRSAR